MGEWVEDDLSQYEAELYVAQDRDGDSEMTLQDVDRHACFAKALAEIAMFRAALVQIAAYEINDNLNYYNARTMIELARHCLENCK